MTWRWWSGCRISWASCTWAGSWNWGRAQRVFENPQHPYTQALMKAVPIADPRQRKSEKDLNFKPIPSPIHGVDYVAEPSVYREVEPGHLILETDSGY